MIFIELVDCEEATKKKVEIIFENIIPILALAYGEWLSVAGSNEYVSQIGSIVCRKIEFVIDKSRVYI